jgi:hypothetical protein
MIPTAQIETVRQVDFTHMPTSWEGFQALGVTAKIAYGTRRVETARAFIRFCKTDGHVMVTVADVARYRLESDLDGSFWAIDGSSLWI